MSATRPLGSPLFRCLPLLFCLGAAACGPGAYDITKFTMEVQTGDKDSDQDMFLCYARDQGSARFECIEISSSGDDFEANHNESFELEPEDAIETDSDKASPSKIESIRIENRGGGFGANGWDLNGFELRAVYGDDSEEVICQESSSAGPLAHLNSGDKYDPPACP